MSSTSKLTAAASVPSGDSCGLEITEAPKTDLVMFDIRYGYRVELKAKKTNRGGRFRAPGGPMQNPIDFKAKNKQIRKLRAAALRRWADRVIAGIDNLLAENLKIIEAIEADQSLPKKERKKLVAKFKQEQTALMCKSAKDIKSKLKSFKNRVSDKVKDLRKEE